MAQKPVQSIDEQTAPSSRQERLRRQRILRAKELKPYRQKIWEGYFLSFDQKGNETLEDSNLKGLYPRFGWIAQGSSLAAGFRYWRPAVKGPFDILGSAFYSLRRYQLYDISLGMIPNRGRKLPPSAMEEEEVYHLGELDRTRLSRFSLYGTARYRHFTQVGYFGSGSDSQKSNETDFLLKQTSFHGTMGYQVTDRMFWNLQSGVLQHALGPGQSGSTPSIEEVFDDSSAPGLSRPPNYFRLRSTFLIDYRDNPGVPHEGFFVAFGWEQFTGIATAEDFDFDLWSLDTRAYLPLGSTQRVIALRASGTYARPDRGSRVPFFLQPSLGGSRLLRGYESNRFRGDRMFQFQAEYRWEPSPRLELAIFGDTGTVSNTGERLSLSRLRSDLGFGVRFKTSRSTLLRVEQAWSQEGTRTIFRFSGIF